MDLKIFWATHKYQILLFALMLAIFVIAGCAGNSGAPPPPSGPIGGGCG